MPPDLSNRGITYFNRLALPPGMTNLQPPRTFILTGLPHSGTSMLAQSVQAAGIFIGISTDHVVHEDLEIGAVLDRRDLSALAAIVARRNLAHQSWAFKRPGWHEGAGPEATPRFRNPHLIVIIRDTAATAQRAIMSERADPWESFEDAARGQLAQLAYLRRVKCPVMLVSYEKAVAFPSFFAEALAEYLGVPATPERLAAIRASVEPDHPGYIRARQRNFEGMIDYVRDGIMSGWARESGSRASISLTLLLDNQPVQIFTAEQMRPDLAAIGFGTGRHGFSVNVRPYLHRPNAVVRLQVTGRAVDVTKGGQTLGQLIR